MDISKEESEGNKMEITKKEGEILNFIKKYKYCKIEHIREFVDKTMAMQKRVEHLTWQKEIAIYEDFITIKSEGVEILPSDLKLSGVENMMINAMNRENILKNIMEEIKEDYDYILIDCLPSLGMLTINALSAADSIIIPVQAQYYSLKGMEQLLETVSRVKRQLNKTLEVEGILITMFDKRTNLSREVESAVITIYGENIKIFKNKIGISTKAAEVPSQGKSLLSYDTKGEVTKSYENLAHEITQKE